ncbi:diguanylate cyclase [Thiorhodospira sibirica]|uniref:diguanylate cyclase n=1 Tax=Thiorhodospira sibirica TaxID=154347 RepID=UPI00022C4671|nr:diguanylate cyclase [Thiorhodospira sibirica]
MKKKSRTVFCSQHPTRSPPSFSSLLPSTAIPAALYLIEVNTSGTPSFTFITDKLLQMLDLSREQVLADAMSVFGRVHPDDSPAFWALSQQLFTTPRPLFWEGRMVVREATHWWRIESLPQPLPEGGTRWEGVVTDITAIKDAEAARTASEARFQRLLQFSPVPLGSLDPSHRTRFYNAAFTETFGYTAADLPDLERWCELAYPDPNYRRWLIQGWEIALSALAAGDASHIPFRATVTCKNGKQKVVDIYHKEFEDGCLGAFIDITEHQRKQRHERELQAILRDVMNAEPLAAIALRIVRAAETMLPNRLCSLLLVDQEQHCLRQWIAPSLPCFYNAALDGLAIFDGNGSCGTAAKRGERVISKDLRTDPAWKAYRGLTERAGLRACWSEPVTNKAGQVLATFALYARQPSVPTGQEIAQISVIVNLMGLAIEHDQVREALAQRTACEVAVRDISRLFLALHHSGLDAAIDNALVRIGTCVAAHRCYLFLMDEGGLTMSCTHEWCSPGTRPQIDELQALPVNHYPWLPEIAQSRQAAWITQDDISQLSPEEQQIIYDGEIQSMLAMPLFQTEQMCGILGLDNIRTAKRWNEFELGLLRLVADMISAALERDRLHQALHEQAYRDTLTGLANRRAFDERLHTEIERARRYSKVFSLLLFDIDHFKAVNDTHGHAVGDQVLQTLAKVITPRLRQTDCLARWGGEEFGLLLPETDANGAMQLAEQLRHGIAAAPFPCVEQLTVSIGITAFTPDDSIDRLFRRVDQALYLAKEQGRNRCALNISYQP